MTVTQVALFSGTAAAALIQTTAKAFGTFVSPTSGEILYVDPNHSEPRHHSPKLTLAEAREAHMRGFIEDFDETAATVEKEEEKEEERDPNAIGTLAAERTAEFAEPDDEGGAGSGTLDSRSSTAWQDRTLVEGGTQDAAINTAPMTDIDQDSGDDDAPPAPTKPARAPKATSK